MKNLIALAACVAAIQGCALDRSTSPHRPKPLPSPLLSNGVILSGTGALSPRQPTPLPAAQPAPQQWQPSALMDERTSVVLGGAAPTSPEASPAPSEGAPVPSFSDANVKMALQEERGAPPVFLDLAGTMPVAEPGEPPFQGDAAEGGVSGLANKAAIQDPQPVPRPTVAAMPPGKPGPAPEFRRAAGVMEVSPPGPPPLPAEEPLFVGRE